MQKRFGALRQIVAGDEPTTVSLTPGIDGIEIVSRGGNLVVSVGEGDQTDGKILPVGHSATVALIGEDNSVTVSLVEPGAPGLLQVSEYVLEADLDGV